MGGKESSSSPKKMKQRRNLSDSRVDELKSNTLYLVNLRFDFKRRRSIEGASENLSSGGDNPLDHCLSEDDGTEKFECTEIGEEYANTKKRESKVKESTDVNVDSTHNLSKDECSGDGDKMACCKSHLCFVAMEYHILKYDRSSCPNTFFTKDTPEYTSFVIGNIFLKKDPDLQFDEAALCDASWEVESLHLCSRIHRLLNAQSTGSADTQSESNSFETSTSTPSTNTNVNTGSITNDSVDTLDMDDGTEVNTSDADSADDTGELDDSVKIDGDNDANDDNGMIDDSSSNYNGDSDYSRNTHNSEYAHAFEVAEPGGNTAHKETGDRAYDTETSDTSTGLDQPRRRDTRILDGFCGIGGNLVHFANNFDFSMGVELDENRVKICENNLRVYEVSGTYEVINDDFFKFAEEFLEDPKAYFETKVNRPDLYRGDQTQFDWVFLSPPWGGSNYKGSNNDEIYVLEEYFPDFYRCLELSSKLGKNITLFLPRSQSIVEIVKAASLSNFKFVLVDSFLMFPTFNKIRCCMFHLLNDVDMFSKNFKIKNAKRMNYKFLSSLSPAKSEVHDTDDSTNSKEAVELDDVHSPSDSVESVNIMPIRNYVFALNHINLMKIGLLKLLNENNLNVYNKLSLLFEQIPASVVLDLVNNAIETYYSDGLRTMAGTKRTLGGTFFYLLKVNYNSTYKNIEKTLRRT
ncbi:hypothetical protein MACJ_000527 [Theileria orientalis]|uniref:Trimethylguanosine synthase n=1 Tax=Theileria orientalis TaxID=68886 RepID=A0A976QUM5_THEOR|nr:hypothetical protein MACJ_000527 [Theileria orientalis]